MSHWKLEQWCWKVNLKYIKYINSNFECIFYLKKRKAAFVSLRDFLNGSVNELIYKWLTFM